MFLSLPTGRINRVARRYADDCGMMLGSRLTASVAGILTNHASGGNIKYIDKYEQRRNGNEGQRCFA